MMNWILDILGVAGILALAYTLTFLSPPQMSGECDWQATIMRSH